MRILSRSVLNTQWPAVMTHRSETRAPPHEIRLLRKLCLITATCHGCPPNWVSSPPTMRKLDVYTSPHSERGRDDWEPKSLLSNKWREIWSKRSESGGWKSEWVSEWERGSLVYLGSWLVLFVHCHTSRIIFIRFIYRRLSLSLSIWSWWLKQREVEI